MNKKITRPISPLQAMTLKSNEYSNELASSKITTNYAEHQNSEQIVQIETAEIQNWSFHDRPEQELGDLEQLAEDIKQNGQQNPCIVRPSLNSNYKFELIAGERRWRACKIAGIRVKAIIKNLNDTEAALCQASENSNRKDLSDYAKGISFHKLLANNILTQRDLATKLNKSQSYIRNLLAFGKIPDQLQQVIGNIHNISGATAYEIFRISEKGSLELEALIYLAPKIGLAINNDKKLQSEVARYILNTKPSLLNSPIEIKNSTGKHLFSWQQNTKGIKSITFSKEIIGQLNFELIENALVTAIDQQLEN